MNRKIVITSCIGCPSMDHKGAFGRISCVPICRKVQRDLPFNLAQGYGGQVQASPTGVIPEWCPLPIDAEGAE